VRSFLATDLISTRSKLKMLKVVVDAVKMRKSIGYDVIDELVPYDVETVSEYSLRELNQELAEYLTGTLIRGAWLAPAEQASIAQFFWTAKHFTPHMYSLVGGMQALPERLLAGIEVRLGTRVLDVEEQADGVTVTHDAGDGERSEEF